MKRTSTDKDWLESGKLTIDADGISIALGSDSTKADKDYVEKKIEAATWTKRQLVNTENLNDIVEPGLYTQAYSNDAKPELNYPHPWRGNLEVTKHLNGAIQQIYTSSYTGEQSIREKYAGDWSEWKPLGANLVTETTLRVNAIESRTEGLKVQPGVNLEVGDFLPDSWASTVPIYWVSPDGIKPISPSYVGEGYVGKVGKTAGYTTQTIKKESASNKFSVTCSNGLRHVTYVVQGDDNAGWLDDMQTVDEIWVGAMNNGEPSLDIELHNSSNLEWAFEIDADGTKQFVPWHGTETAVKYQPTQLTDSSGTPINLAGMKVGEKKTVNGIKLRMFLDAFNTSTPDIHYVRIIQVTTISPDGLLQSESVWTALRDFTIGSNYAPMTVVKIPRVDTFTTATGASYSLPKQPPAQTNYQVVDEGRGFTSGLFTGPDDVFVAAAFINPERTWMEGYPNVETSEPLKLEFRNSGQIKLYPTVFKSGEIVPAGTTWRMGGQWRYGQTDFPEQYK